MGNSRTLIAMLAVGLALAACTPQAAADDQAAPPATTAPPAIVPASTDAGQTPSAPGNCVIETSDRVWLDAPCEHTVNGPGFIVLNSGGGEGDDYAYLTRETETQATGSWSGGGGAGHAHSPLGDLTRDGDSDCWASDIARICLSPAAAADFGVPPSE